MTTIDPRATERGVMVVTPRGIPLTWRVVRVQWLDAHESQGRHHIYVNVLNEAGERLVGIPLRVTWPTGEARIVTEAKPGEQYSANFPMSPSRNEFSITVDGLALSEVVAGIGMGMDTPSGFNAGIHTTTGVVFQRVGVVSAPPPSIEAPTPAEPTPAPMPTGIIPPRVAQAILKVESGGRTHGDDGLVLIRFEAHIFKAHLKNDALWAEYFRVDANKPWLSQEWRSHPDKPWATLHTGKQNDEYAAFTLAQALAQEAAFKSISMGAAQIMGFNHARIGYATATAMLEAFYDAPMQTIGFINFCLSDPALIAAMRDRDFDEVARRYNGAGNVAVYGKLLRDAYASLGG